MTPLKMGKIENLIFYSPTEDSITPVYRILSTEDSTTPVNRILSMKIAQQ